MEELPTKEDVVRLHAAIELHVKVCRGIFPGLDDKEMSRKEMGMLFSSLTSTIVSLSVHMDCLPTTVKNLRLLADRIDAGTLHEIDLGYMLTETIQ